MEGRRKKSFESVNQTIRQSIDFLFHALLATPSSSFSRGRAPPPPRMQCMPPLPPKNPTQPYTFPSSPLRSLLISHYSSSPRPYQPPPPSPPRKSPRSVRVTCGGGGGRGGGDRSAAKTPRRMRGCGMCHRRLRRHRRRRLGGTFQHCDKPSRNEGLLFPREKYMQ